MTLGFHFRWRNMIILWSTLNFLLVVILSSRAFPIFHNNRVGYCRGWSADHFGTHITGIIKNSQVLIKNSIICFKIIIYRYMWQKVGFEVLAWFDRARSADHFPAELCWDIFFWKVLLPRARLGRGTGIIPSFTLWMHRGLTLKTFLVVKRCKNRCHVRFVTKEFLRFVTDEFLRLVNVGHIVDVIDTNISHSHHITHLMILIIDKVIKVTL